MRGDPFDVYGRKHAEKFIKKLKKENRNYFSLKEIIDEIPEGRLRELFALHTAAHIIKKLGGKFELKFFEKF